MKKLCAIALSLCLILSAVGAFADSIVFGTAATSGTYYQVGAAIGTAISNTGLQVNVSPTAGSNENVSMAQTGDIDIGMDGHAQRYQFGPRIRHTQEYR